MAGAYYEKIARINLTTGEIKVEPLDLELAHKFIGGRGLGTKMLYDEGIATVDPLSPENKLIYITGPMTGAAAPSTGRYMVCTKSPPYRHDCLLQLRRYLGCQAEVRRLGCHHCGR